MVGGFRAWIDWLEEQEVEVLEGKGAYEGPRRSDGGEVR